MKKGMYKKGRTNKISLKRAVCKYHNYYLMLLPGLIFVVMFLYIPIFYNFIAFKDYQIFNGPFGSPWCGLDNFEKLFRTPDFIRIMKNTFALCFWKILIGFPIPVLLALLLNEVTNKWFKKTVQTIVYLPAFHIVGNYRITGNNIAVPDGRSNQHVAGKIGIEPIFLEKGEIPNIFEVFLWQLIFGRRWDGPLLFTWQRWPVFR